jgi:hypothetical protein
LKLSDMNIINGIVYFRVSELLKQSRPKTAWAKTFSSWWKIVCCQIIRSIHT